MKRLPHRVGLEDLRVLTSPHFLPNKTSLSSLSKAATSVHLLLFGNILVRLIKCFTKLGANLLWTISVHLMSDAATFDHVSASTSTITHPVHVHPFVPINLGQDPLAQGK